MKDIAGNTLELAIDIEILNDTLRIFEDEIFEDEIVNGGSYDYFRFAIEGNSLEKICK